MRAVVAALAAVGVSALRPHVRLPTARRGTRSFAAPTVEYYIVDGTGEQRGPYAPAVLKEWWDGGHINERTYCFAADGSMSDWALLPEIAPLEGYVRSLLRDEPAAAAELDEVVIDTRAASAAQTLGERIQRGGVVVRVPQVASAAELQALLAAGVDACDAERERTGQTPETGRNRFSVSDKAAFSEDVVLRCEEILLRVIDYVDEQMPSVYDTLFRPGDEWAARQPPTASGGPPAGVPPIHLADTCPSLRELYMAGEFEWSEGEPAINVYTERGRFGAHKDHLALTVLIPLTSPADDFSGGGTGFWSMEAIGSGLDEGQEPEGEPAAVLKPPLGTALIFGGDVTHAGMPVETGLRSVMVASFSTRTPASPADRVNGLHSAQSSSSLREGMR